MSSSPPATGSEAETSPMDLEEQLNQMDVNIRTPTPDAATPDDIARAPVTMEPPLPKEPAATLSTPVAPVPASIPITANQGKSGQPLLPQHQMNILSDACRILHGTYMEMAKQKKTRITVAFRQGDFFHYEDECEFYIYFENDLYDFFHLNPIDSSFLRCWTLYMMTEAKQRNDPIGFLDAYMVSAPYIKAQRSSALKYVRNALRHQADRNHVIFAYLEEGHWITVVLALRHKKVYYLDSLKSMGRNYTAIKKMLDEAFLPSGPTSGGQANGSIFEHVDITCHQQPDSNLCGFYTMYHMQLIADFLKTNKDLNDLNCSSEPLKTDKIEQIRERVACFINSQVINHEGEFHAAGMSSGDIPIVNRIVLCVFPTLHFFDSKISLPSRSSILLS